MAENAKGSLFLFAVNVFAWKLPAFVRSKQCVRPVRSKPVKPGDERQGLCTLTTECPCK